MALELVILCCISALVSAQNLTYESSEAPQNDVYKLRNRVIGGRDAARAEFPYQVSLQLGRSHICGGSIIHEKWILTAAHCVRDLPVFTQLVVKAGKTFVRTYEDTEQTGYVDKIFVHHKYRGSVSPNDIALVKLTAPLKYNSFVRSIELPKAGSMPKGTLILSGWGSTSKTEKVVLPDRLQTAQLTLVDLANCRQAMKNLQQPSEIDDTNLCTGPTDGLISACNGDSGGPLVEKRGKSKPIKLVGIVSWGTFPCARLGAPAIFTRVSGFVDWIRAIMKNNK